MDDLTTYAHHMGRILKVLVYIDSHLDKELSLEKMSKIASISPFHFHRLFHAYLGETLNDYVKRLRLQRSFERLQYSDTSITEIAMDLGYETPSAFTKMFNQIMGKSPRQYRKAMQLQIQAIMKRISQRVRHKPEYVKRQDETVLFVRRVGDYHETPYLAFEVLLQFLEKKGVMPEQINAFFSMGLDDPHTVDRSKCRFDVCVSLNVNIAPEGEVGQKVLPGGRYAVFIHKGPYSSIEAAFEEILLTSTDLLADSCPFCEFLDIDDSIPDSERITKLYIPLK